MNGEADAYARVMDRRENSFRGEVIELDLALAERFLSGEVIRSRGSDSFVYVWEGERLAGGKGPDVYYPQRETTMKLEIVGRSVSFCFRIKWALDLV